MERVKWYILESYQELVERVTWPTWPQLINTTNVVLIASAIFAIIIFFFDLVSKQIMDFIYSLG